MKKYLLFISLLLVLSFAFAQTAGKDIVYLKNSSVLYGMIMEVDSNVSVTLKVSDETVLVIANEDIKEIIRSKEAQTSSKEMPKKSMKLNLTPKQGVYKIIQFRGGQAFPSITTSVGYSLKNHSFGVGAALQPYLNIGLVTPVFAEYRYEVGKKEKRIKPLILGQIGYGFPYKTSNARRDVISGGMYWNVGLGYKEYTARKFQWTYGFVFSQQYTHEVWDERFQNWNPNTQSFINTVVHFNAEKVYNRFLISWGLWF